MNDTFLINAANLQKGGGLQVALSLLQEWSNFDACRFIVLASPQLAAAHPTFDNGCVSLVPLAQNPTASIAAWRTFLATARRLEDACRPGAVLTIFGPALWRPRVPHLMGFANGLYLFSDSRFIRDDWPVGRLARARYFLRRRVLLHRVRREADAWWVETTIAKDALAKAIGVDGNRVQVIPNALADAFRAGMNDTSEPPVAADRIHRLLVMGAHYPNKNLGILAALHALLQDSPVRFQATLPQQDFVWLFGQDGMNGRIENLGPLQTADLPAAYAAATAVFFPSKLETFSAVYLEAMAARRPILTSDLPFARAVCSDAAHYFDPWNAEDAARAISDVMNSPDLRARLVGAGRQRLRQFPTAADRATALLALLKSLAGRHSS